MTVPTQAQIDAIRLTRGSEFELNEREAKVLRSRLYAINKDGIRRYRTMREGQYIIVWRIQ